MWPFNRKQTDEQRVREAFGDFVSKDVLDSILTNPDNELKPPRLWRCAYVLLQVRDAEPEKVPDFLDMAVDILLPRGACVTNLFSSLLLATFGLPLVDDDLEKGRSQQAKAVARLISDMGSNVRLVYGTDECLAGNVGSRQRIDIGVLLPDTASKLAALLSVEFGKSAAI